MADLEVPSIARAAERPFHQAFQQKKLPCPHSQCMNENCFYLPDGLDHHFRTIHGWPSTMRDVEEAKTLLRVKHAAETLAWISITCSNLINRHVKMFPLVLLLLFCWLFDLFFKLLPARISMISRNINLYDNLMLCRMILGWVNFQLFTTISKKPFEVLMLRRLPDFRAAFPWCNAF